MGYVCALPTAVPAVLACHIILVPSEMRKGQPNDSAEAASVKALYALFREGIGTRS